MEQKRYIKEVYAKSWLVASENHYGFSLYVNNLCDLILGLVPKESKLLEVAIGTGYPFAEFFQKTGYAVSGVDISPELIMKCRRLYPNINCQIGDAEELPYPPDNFDVTYCLQSTWYFPNLMKAIDEMIRVTRLGGYIIFDIQNRNNNKIASGYQKRVAETTGLGRFIRIVKNLVLVVLRRKPNWFFVFHPTIHEAPEFPESIYEHLKMKGISNFQVWAEKADQSLELKNSIGSFGEFERLVFAIKK